MLLSSFSASVLLFFSSFGSQALLPPFLPTITCPSISVSYKSTAKADGMFSLEFSVNGGKGPYKFIFYEESGKLVSEEFNRSIFRSLKPGSYQLTVIDSRNCRETKSILLQ